MVGLLAFIFWDEIPTTQAAIATILAALVYSIVAYWTDALPARDNVGALGGLVNQPFRKSDDYNRLLAMTALVLWPGRFITAALRDAVRLSLRSNSDVGRRAR